MQVSDFFTRLLVTRAHLGMFLSFLNNPNHKTASIHHFRS
jgi:hypothetical protein